jgi:hypothetical protein
MLQETGLRVTEDFVYAHNAAGEVLSEYRRHKSPLYRLYEPAILKGRAGELAEYEAGAKFARLYRESGWDPWQRAPHSDPTRIFVSGAGRAPDELSGSDGAKIALERIEAFLGLATHNILIGVCGQELSVREYASRAQLDRRAVRKRLRNALERLTEWFRKN